MVTVDSLAALSIIIGRDTLYLGPLSTYKYAPNCYFALLVTVDRHRGHARDNINLEKMSIEEAAELTPKCK